MISQNIQAARKALGLTQEDLANRLSVARQTVAKWESGESLPDLENAYALAKLLGVLSTSSSRITKQRLATPFLPAGSTSSASCAWENADRWDCGHFLGRSRPCSLEPHGTLWGSTNRATA